MSNLVHYGVKGMKWGVRNYQNKDGTYTALGKARRKEQAENKKAEKAKAEYGESTALSTRHKETRDLPTSNKELVRQGEYWYNQHGEMLADIRYEPGMNPHNNRVGRPNEVYEYYEAGKRQVDRNIRDNRGVLAQQVHGGPHKWTGKKKPDYQNDGMHIHDFDESGHRFEYPTGLDGRDLTDRERKEHYASLKRK